MEEPLRALKFDTGRRKAILPRMESLGYMGYTFLRAKARFSCLDQSQCGIFTDGEKALFSVDQIVYLIFHKSSIQ